MSLVDPHLIGLTPGQHSANLVAGVRRRVSTLERRGGGSGGTATTFANTTNIEFTVSGSVTANIPITAEPRVAKLGIGMVPVDYLDITSSGIDRAINSVHNIATTDVVTAGYRPWRFVMNNKTTDSGSGASIGLSVANYFGGSTSSVAAHGTTHAATFDTIVMGSDSVANEQASVYMSLLDKTSDLAGSQPGTMWLTDTKVVGVLPTYAAGGATPQQQILSGHNLLINKYQTASPALSDSVGIAISTRPMSAASIGTPQGSQTTVPVDVGIGITGVSGAYSPLGTGISFLTAIRIGGNRTPWYPGSSPVSYGESHIGTGIEIADWDTEGIRIHRRWAGSTGKALSLGFDTAGVASTSFRDGINFGDDVHLYRGATNTLAIDGSLSVAGELLDAHVGRVSAGGLTLGMSSQTAAYGPSVTEHGVFANATGAPFIVTAPGSPTTGQTMTVIKTDASANAVTISGSGQTFDGASTRVLTGQYDSATMIFDGVTAWYSIGGGGTASGSAGGHLTGTYPNPTFLTTATPQLARLGLGVAAGTSRITLPVGTAVADGIDFGGDASLWRSAAGTLRVNSRLNFWDTPGTSLAIDFSTSLDGSYPFSNINSGVYRELSTLVVDQGHGTNGLRYRATGGIRAAAGATTISGQGTAFNTDLVGGNEIHWRSGWNTTGKEVVSGTPGSATSATISPATSAAIAPGQITVANSGAGGVAVATGTGGTLFLSQLQANDIVRTAVQNLTVATIQSDTQFTATAAGTVQSSAVNYYVPWGKNSDRIAGDASVGFWGGDGSTAWRGHYYSLHQKGYGSHEAIGITGTMWPAASGGVDGYGELNGMAIQLTTKRLGGFVGNEFGLITEQQGRTKGLLIVVTESNTYNSWASCGAFASIPTSPWRETGSRGLWIMAAGAGQAGTGLFITNRLGSDPFKRPIVVNQDSQEDGSPGTDVFVVDLNGRLALAGATTVRQGVNDSANFTNLGSLILPGTNGAIADGIRFGVDAGYFSLFRSADNTGKVTGNFVVSDVLACLGAINVAGATDTTGFVQYSECATAPVGNSNTARVYSDDDGSSNTRLNVRFGTGSPIVLATQGGGGGGGGYITAISDTNTIDLTVTGTTLSGDIPTTATPRVTTLGVGNATALGGGATGLFLSNGGQMDTVNAAGAWLRNYAAVSDANAAVQILFSGEYRMGAGGASAPDIGFVRAAANILKITDGTTSGGAGFRAGRIGLGIDPDVSIAKVIFPSTNAVADGISFGIDANRVTLYRSANDMLKTDDSMHIATALGIGQAATSTALSFVAATTATGGINFGGDVTLYRSAADTLKTDDHMKFAQTVELSGRLLLTSATSGYVEQASQTSSPATPSSGRAHTYIRNGKYVVAYNDAGTVKYHYLDLTSTADDGPWKYLAAGSPP